jgi:hypothetical protein
MLDGISGLIFLLVFLLLPLTLWVAWLYILFISRMF